MQKPVFSLRTLRTLCGAVLLLSSTWTSAALPELAGHWRLDDDPTVLELVHCEKDKTAVCAVTRTVPPALPNDPQTTQCGDLVGVNFRPSANGKRWYGGLRDTQSGDTTPAWLQLNKKGELEPVMKAMGGLASHKSWMKPVTEFTPCSKDR